MVKCLNLRRLPRVIANTATCSSRESVRTERSIGKRLRALYDRCSEFYVLIYRSREGEARELICSPLSAGASNFYAQEAAVANIKRLFVG